MSKRVWYPGVKRSYLNTEVPPCWIMDGTKAWELYHTNKPTVKKPGQETLDGHMADIDLAWRKQSGKRPYAELDAFERLRESGWNRPKWEALLAGQA